MKQFFSSLTQNLFLRNSSVLFLGIFLANILNYFFHLVVGRAVDPKSYGEVEALFSLLIIVSVPASAITLLMMRYVAVYKAKNDLSGIWRLLLYINRKIFFIGIPVFFLCLLLSPWIKGFLQIDTIFPLALLFVAMFVSFLSATSTGALNGLQKFGAISAVEVSSASSRLLFAFLFINVGFGVNGTMGGLVLAMVLGYYISILFLRKTVYLKKTNTSQDVERDDKFSSLHEYFGPAFLGAFSLALFSSVDMVFAKHHLAPEIAGAYGALTVIAKTLFFATGVMTTVLFSMSAEESHHKRKVISRTLVISVFSTFLLVSVANLFFFLFPEFILKFFFGEKYLLSSSFLIWFGVASGLYGFGNLLLQYLLSIKQTRAMKYFFALSSLEVALLFFFGEGMYAIIAITIVSQAFFVLLGLYFLVQEKYYEQKNIDSYSSL